MNRIPIEQVRISHVGVSARYKLGQSHPFVLFAAPINLFQEGCTCEALGECPTCKAWSQLIGQQAQRRHHA